MCAIRFFVASRLGRDSGTSGIAKPECAEPPASERGLFLFDEPLYPLLTAQLTDDEGYFKERLAKGHAELIRTWRERTRSLQPEFSHTDVLGALLLAGQQFATTKRECRKVLIVFSDMRQSTPLLDLERGDRVVHEQSEFLRRAQNEFPVDLHGVQVYVLGVDASESRLRTGKV